MSSVADTARPFLSLFEESPATVVETLPAEYDDNLQMNVRPSGAKGGTAQETQAVTRNGEPDYERDWEDD